MSFIFTGTTLQQSPRMPALKVAKAVLTLDWGRFCRSYRGLNQPMGL